MNLFNDTIDTLTNATIIVTAVLLVLLIVAYFVGNYLHKLFNEKIKSKSNAIHIYVLDIKNDKVNYFNSAKLRGRKSMSVTSFYSKFLSKDRESLITWVGDLLDESIETKNSIEVTLQEKNGKKKIAYLQVKKIDYQKELIYLDSHILNYNVVTKRNGQSVFVSREAFFKAFKQHEATGLSFCLSFFNRVNKTNGINHLAFLEIKNILSQFANDRVILSTNDESRFYIANYAISDKIQALEFIEKVQTKVSSYLSLESFEEEIDFTIGCSENQYFHNDVKSLIKSLASLSDNAKDNNHKILFFDENSSELGEDSSFKSEVQNIISSGKIRYSYQPMIDTTYKRIVGYLSYMQPTDSIFKNIVDLKHFAIRTDDDQQLFSAMAKHCINNFNEERVLTNQSLFMPILFHEMKYVSQSLKNVTYAKESNVVICLETNDIDVSTSDNEMKDDLADYIRSFKSIGFNVALRISNEVLDMSPGVYQAFDYFILSMKDLLPDNDPSSIAVFKGLMERLLKFNKQIIIIDIAKWDEVELVYKFGVNIICGDAIASRNENLLPLDKKTFTKLKKLDA